MDNFCQSPNTPNTQGENANGILTSERINNSNALEETLKGLKINDAEYYSSFKNDAEGDPASDPKLSTHTSDGKKRNFTDTSNRNLQQQISINRTLPIIITTNDPRILDRVATFGGTPLAQMMPTMKPVVTDATCSSARVL